MTKEWQKATWMALMMSEVRKRYGYSRAEFVPIASKYNIPSFLLEHYELLHYYSNEAVVDEISRYTKEQGGDLSALRRAI